MGDGDGGLGVIIIIKVVLMRLTGNLLSEALSVYVMLLFAVKLN